MWRIELVRRSSERRRHIAQQELLLVNRGRHDRQSTVLADFTDELPLVVSVDDCRWKTVIYWNAVIKRTAFFSPAGASNGQQSARELEFIDEPTDDEDIDEKRHVSQDHHAAGARRCYGDVDTVEAKLIGY